jgi:spermidine/putrescine transport system substrate-binding protein
MSINKITKKPFFVLFLSFFALIACTKKENATSRVVNLAIWGNYLTPDVQEEFQKKTGIKINITNYSSNEELLAKVQSGASGLDVAVPSDYMVDIMIKTNLLEPIDGSKISHKSLIYENLLNQSYDPGNKYSYPYAWSTAGIAINKTLYKKPIKSWKEFFNNPDLSGKISLMDDVREVVAAAMKLHGHSVNSTDPKELEEAKKSLLNLKPRVKMFRSDTVEALLNKEVAVAHAFSSDALQAARKSNGDIEYVIPDEGDTRAIDNLVIVKGATHVAEAHQLIDFLLSPEVNVKFVSHILAGPVLKTTKASLPKDIQNNKALFPSENVFKKLEPIRDLGEKTQVLDQLWTEVKSR